MRSYVVIGLGRFGTELATQLASQNCEVLAIDIHEEAVQQISPYVTQAVVADAGDKGVLRALGVKDFDCAVVAIGGSLAASILATINLQELGVPKILCKAHDETHRQVLMKLGVEQVVIPEKEHAARLAKSLTSPNVLDYIELSEDYGIIEVPAPARWVGKSIKELNIRAKLGVNIIAMEREGRIQVSPGADYVILEKDVLVVLGDTRALQGVQKL